MLNGFSDCCHVASVPRTDPRDNTGTRYRISTLLPSPSTVFLPPALFLRPQHLLLVQRAAESRDECLLTFNVGTKQRVGAVRLLGTAIASIFANSAGGSDEALLFHEDGTCSRFCAWPPSPPLLACRDCQSLSCVSPSH